MKPRNPSAVGNSSSLSYYSAFYVVPQAFVTMDQEKKTETIVTVRPVYFRTMSGESEMSKKFRDNEDDETSSQISSTINLDELEAGRSVPKWYRRGGSKSLMRWFGAPDASKNNRRRPWLRWLLVAAVVSGFFGVVAAM
jgi:hypothetical protein